MIRMSAILLPVLFLYILFSNIGCSLLLQAHEVEVSCDPTLDSNFRGCYKPTDTTQYISIVQGNCSYLSGTGRGILDGLEADIAWSFSGTVQAVDSANLTITIEPDAVERSVTVTQNADGILISENGHPTIRLTEYGTCP